MVGSSGGDAGSVSDDRPPRVRIAMLCISNLNRSMEAHSMCLKAGYKVWSFGTGTRVKLPGESIDEPNVYQFGAITYDEIYEDLKKKNHARLVCFAVLF